MTTPPPPPPRPRRWIWYFVVLTLLAVAAITINIVFNLWQQLKPEQLEHAALRWREHGPASYTMRYVVKNSNGEPEVYDAEVRGGRVVAARLNDRLLEPRLWSYHDMRGRFADIRRFLDEDAKPGKPRVFVKARFDDKTGQLKHYLRSVSATRERVEIAVVELVPVDEQAP
jgi:hypothetical protein